MRMQIDRFLLWMADPEQVGEFLARMMLIRTICGVMFLLSYPAIILIKTGVKIMDNLRRFFKENMKPAENEKVVISDRFTDEDGNPLEWEIKPISNEFDDKLREECTTQTKIKKGVYIPKLEYPKYLKKLLTSCVVYPNLNNEELQNSFGAMGAEELLSNMLLPGEYNFLAETVQEICGFDKDIMENKIEEAKN